MVPSTHLELVCPSTTVVSIVQSMRAPAGMRAVVLPVPARACSSSVYALPAWRLQAAASLFALTACKPETLVAARFTLL
jgi:hypothetical protein